MVSLVARSSYYKMKIICHLELSRKVLLVHKVAPLPNQGGLLRTLNLLSLLSNLSHTKLTKIRRSMVKKVKTPSVVVEMSRKCPVCY